MRQILWQNWTQTRIVVTYLPETCEAVMAGTDNYDGNLHNKADCTDGMMGAGSPASARLAKRLKLSFVDADSKSKPPPA